MTRRGVFAAIAAWSSLFARPAQERWFSPDGEELIAIPMVDLGWGLAPAEWLDGYKFIPEAKVYKPRIPEALWLEPNSYIYRDDKRGGWWVRT
jgi:hypothetical protein